MFPRGCPSSSRVHTPICKTNERGQQYQQKNSLWQDHCWWLPRAQPFLVFSFGGWITAGKMGEGDGAADGAADGVRGIAADRVADGVRGIAADGDEHQLIPQVNHERPSRPRLTNPSLTDSDQ